MYGGIWGNWSPAIYFIAPPRPSNLNPQAQKQRGRAGGEPSAIHIFQTASAKSDIFATKYKVVYNNSDELNFWEEPGFDPSSTNWGGLRAGEKKTCQKFDFFG